MDIAVIKIRRPAVCSECGEELGSGRLLRVENERPACMGCDDLEKSEDPHLAPH